MLIASDWLAARIQTLAGKDLRTLRFIPPQTIEAALRLRARLQKERFPQGDAGPLYITQARAKQATYHRFPKKRRCALAKPAKSYICSTMFLKAIVWGFLLFGLIFLGNETQRRFLSAKLDAEHIQDTPLGIHKSGTILKFAANAEFEIPLLPAINTAYENGFSDSLIRYLTHHHKKIVPYWETPSELRFELDLLTDRLIRERQFTVVNTITGQRQTSFTILPESDAYYYAYAYQDGSIFYEDKEPEFSFTHVCGLSFEPIRYAIHFEDKPTGTIYLCKPWSRAPSPPQLAMTLDHAEPDLSTEFLRVLANPDPTVY